MQADSYLLTVLCLLCVIFHDIDSIWWAVGGPMIGDPRKLCRRVRRYKGVGAKAAQYCVRQGDLEIVSTVLKGVRSGIKECQWQLQYHQWNCSTYRRSLGKMLLRDTKESALLEALAAGAVAHVVARACSNGQLRTCTCAPSTRGSKMDEYKQGRSNVNEFEWEGCSDNVEFGFKLSRDFLDADFKAGSSDRKTLIQKHNNEVGRLMVAENVKKQCKCHGVSGTCEMRTCWLNVPYFRDTGDRLLKSFRTSRLVTQANDGSRLLWPVDAMKSTSSRHESSGKSSAFHSTDVSRPSSTPHPRPLSSMELVYSEESPDFCRRNRKTGILGSRGRECLLEDLRGERPEREQLSSCTSLCCGRGVSSKQVTENGNCNCKFHWCCKVKCDPCMKTVHKFYCE